MERSNPTDMWRDKKREEKREKINPQQKYTEKHFIGNVKLVRYALQSSDHEPF
jgi:hypothetical protein